MVCWFFQCNMQCSMITWNVTTFMHILLPIASSPVYDAPINMTHMWYACQTVAKRQWLCDTLTVCFVWAGSVSNCLFLGGFLDWRDCMSAFHFDSAGLCSLPQVSWGLIVRIKYSWKHWVDKWRYKHTVKFSIGQVSLTSLDTIYCTTWHSL